MSSPTPEIGLWRNATKAGHESRLAAIQDLYPNPPVLRYHRLAPKMEREFGETEGHESLEVRQSINWMDMAVAFLLGYLIGSRKP